MSFPRGRVAYDPAGNRIRETTTGAEASDKVYAYDAINRLLGIDSNVDTEDVAYQYDPNGNTTQKTKNSVTTTFRYDIRNQLGEVREGASILGRYGYDFDGRRILKIGNEGRRQYTYDQLSVITEADPANATVSKYDYGLDQLVRLDNRTEGRSFFHLDVLRSTVGLTDAAGGARQSIFYDAWGNERDRVGASANKFTFTGHEKDHETGLIYARARFYDPDIGRFLTQDSFLGDASNAPSLHRYFYANANPTRFVDPLGLASFEVRDIDSIRAELATFTKEEGQSFAEGTVADPTGNVRASPSKVLLLLLEQHRSTERAQKAIKDLVARNATHVAFIVLEEDDFGQDDRLIADKIFNDFLVEVGTFAKQSSGLLNDLLEEIGPTAAPGDIQNISESFNAGFSFSANEAERRLGKLVDRVVELRNDQGPEMWLLRHSTRENIKASVRFPFFAKLAFEGLAPREFKFKFTALSAQQGFVFALTRGGLRSRDPRTPTTPGTGRLGGAFKDVRARGGQVHHMPADSISPLKRTQGPAIRMDTADHVKTGSWGKLRSSVQYRARQKQLIEQGKFREAVQMDIDDIRSKFGDKYDEAIEQMLEYLDTLPADELLPQKQLTP